MKWKMKAWLLKNSSIKNPPGKKEDVGNGDEEQRAGGCSVLLTV